MFLLYKDTKILIETTLLQVFKPVFVNFLQQTNLFFSKRPIYIHFKLIVLYNYKVVARIKMLKVRFYIQGVLKIYISFNLPYFSWDTPFEGMHNTWTAQYFYSV